MKSKKFRVWTGDYKPYQLNMACLHPRHNPKLHQGTEPLTCGQVIEGIGFIIFIMAIPVILAIVWG